MSCAPAGWISSESNAQVGDLAGPLARVGLGEALDVHDRQATGGRCSMLSGPRMLQSRPES
jgi:hypothetical protein